MSVLNYDIGETIAQILIDYSDSLRDYIAESGTNLAHDERESREFVDIFLKLRGLSTTPEAPQAEQGCPKCNGYGIMNVDSDPCDMCVKQAEQTPEDVVSDKEIIEWLRKDNYILQKADKFEAYILTKANVLDILRKFNRLTSKR